MVTFTINIHPMLAYIPYMDPMGMVKSSQKMAKMILNHPKTSSNPLLLTPRQHLRGRRTSGTPGKIPERGSGHDGGEKTLPFLMTSGWVNQNKTVDNKPVEG
jgi:hypothetical protein